MTALKVFKQIHREESLPDSHKDLKVWQRAMEMVRFVYTLGDAKDGTGECCLLHGLRELALEIPTHISRGSARGSTADFLRALASARGALAALETHAILAQQLNYIDLEERRKIEVLMVEVKNLMEQLSARLL